ncbi:MAG: polysaccharide biosynthesis protein [Clostridia bacterium]|jgi:stage V sporulation protein B|nr:polysaccharide biosynthesis protein [Clostridia bacterium]
MEIQKQSFIKGAAILAAAGLITKIIGAIYRIPLGRIVGSEVMGYSQTGYEVYVWALTISAYAIPIAISKLVSEKIETGRKEEAHRIFKVALLFTSSIGLLLSLIMFRYADVVASLFRNPGAYLAIVCIVPSIFIFSITGTLRGYFQGMQNMIPSALSQITEQLGRVVFGFVLALMFLPYGNQQTAGGANAGTAIGGAISVVTLIYFYRKSRNQFRDTEGIVKRDRESTFGILKKILIISIPITIGGSMMPIMNLLDTFIVMDRLLAAGYSSETAVSMYGQLKAMAGSFVNLPQVLTISLAASLVPAIAESMAKKDYVGVAKKSELSIRVSLIVGLPAAMGLFILADPIMSMMYPEETKTLGIAMAYLSPAIIFLTLVQTLTAILQGMGKERIPVINLFIGAVVKIIVSYTLTSIPYINVRGAALGTVAGYSVAAALNMIYIIKYQGYGLNYIKAFFKPAAATLAMMVAAYLTYNTSIKLLESNSLATLLSIIIAASIYGVVLILIRGISIEELQMAPGGGRLSSILKKKGLLK